jgi:hypothetical protein
LKEAAGGAYDSAMELVGCFGTFALLGGAIPNQNSIGDMVSHVSPRPKAGRRASGFVLVA